MDRCAECGFVYDLDAPAADVVESIRLGVVDVAALLRDPDGDLRSRRDPAVWSPLEYGCHLRDTFLVQRERVLAARRSGEPVEFALMGRDERVEHDGYADQDPTDVARELTDAARLFGGVLSRLSTADWNRTAVYPYPKPTERSLRWVAANTLHEVRHHTLDMRRQLLGSA
jgi:DinB superfamily